MGFLTDTAHGEQAVLTTFLRQQFAQVRSTAFGLDDEQITRRSTVSAYSIGSLLRHVGDVAQAWGRVMAGEQLSGDYTSDQETGEMTAAEILAEFDARVAALDTVLEELRPLDTPVPVPQRSWFPAELTTWELRWVLSHLITEVSRHAGHADIVRESIDGKGAYELNALADGEEWSPEWAYTGEDEPGQ